MKTYTYHLVGGFADFDPSPAGPMTTAPKGATSEFTNDLIDVTFDATPVQLQASLLQTFGIMADLPHIEAASAAGSTLLLLLRPATAARDDMSSYHLWFVPPRAAEVNRPAAGTPVH